MWDGSVADYSTILNQIDSGEVRIGSAAEFAAFRDLVCGKDPSYTDGFLGIEVILDIDLDMTSQDWEPIGDVEIVDSSTVNIAPFLGTFNGNNHTIKYKFEGTDEDLDSYGLFDVTYGLTDPVVIKNLKVEANVSVPSSYYGAGLIVGMSFGEIRFENCHVLPDSSLSVNDGNWGHAGGFISYINHGALFTNCTNGADITADGYAGGFAGQLYTTAQDYSDVACEFQDCHNTGDITSNGWYAGGILGEVDRSDGGTIKYINCSNDGSISGRDAGGIVGNNYGQIDEMANCSGGTSQITGTESSGRLVGRLYSDSTNNDISIISIDDASGDSYDSIITIGLLENSNATLQITSGTFHGIPQVKNDWTIFITEDANWVGEGVPENPSGKSFVLSPGDDGVTISEKPESGAP